MHIKNHHYAYANMYDFKCNISKYMRMLDEGKYKGMILQKYHKNVAILLPFNPKTPYVDPHSS